MFEDDPQSWSGDTPTPSASTSGSSVSTLTVDETAFLSKCDVGEAFELTYWAAIREYWKEDPEDGYDLRSGQKHGEEEAEELPSDIFELVEISLDDDSDLKADSVLPNDGLAKLIGRWWETNVSMIIPDGHEIRDHFCMSSQSLFDKYLSPRANLFLSECTSFRKDLSSIFPNGNVPRNELGDAFTVLHFFNSNNGTPSS
jgi:hypothetical protein